jgi:hypothetical protein
MNFREVRCEGVNWMELAKDRNQGQTSLVTVTDLLVFLKKKVGDFLTYTTCGKYPRRLFSGGTLKLVEGNEMK